MQPRHLALVRLTRRRLAPSLALLLACALLWGQWLGQVHRVLHLPGMDAAHAQEVEAGAAHDVVAHLLAPADDAPDCRLYDQLGQGWGTAQSLPGLSAFALPLVAAWAARACHPSRTHSPFSARAPPLR